MSDQDAAQVSDALDGSDESADDVALSALRIAVSLVPIPGVALAVTTATEALGIYMSRKARSSVEALYKDVLQRLAVLEDRGLLRVADLQQNEAFFTALVNAGHAATRTRQREKLAALRNAVVNSAMPEAPEEALQEWYLSLIERLTVWHIELLAIVADAGAWLDRRGLPVNHRPGLTNWSLIKSTFSYLNAPTGMYKICVDDLMAAGLVQPANNPDPETAKYSIQHLTRAGRQFIEFITSPIPSLDDTAEQMP